MDAKQAAALRKPFPAETIGKLPRGGVMLDYVGHAAITDRLLAVDPEWTWEPLAVGDDGLPAMDAAGNLWIRLTVCGVTRLGVGDGKNQKERIGDALRNAAMRFGVALDLWAKEDLHEFRQTAEQTNGTAPAPVSLKADTGEQVSPAQVKKIAILMGQRGITDRDKALAYVADAIGRTIESRNDLTKTEASELITRLTGQPVTTGSVTSTPMDQPGGTDPWQEALQ